jgi:hypothetical protein
VAAVALVGYVGIAVGWMTGAEIEKGGWPIPWPVVLIAWTVALTIAYGTVALDRRKRSEALAQVEEQRRAKRFEKRQARRQRRASR